MGRTIVNGACVIRDGSGDAESSVPESGRGGARGEEGGGHVTPGCYSKQGLPPPPATPLLLVLRLAAPGDLAAGSPVPALLRRRAVLSEEKPGAQLGLRALPSAAPAPTPRPRPAGSPPSGRRLPPSSPHSCLPLPGPGAPRCQPGSCSLGCHGTTLWPGGRDSSFAPRGSRGWKAKARLPAVGLAGALSSRGRCCLPAVSSPGLSRCPWGGRGGGRGREGTQAPCVPSGHRQHRGAPPHDCF